MDEPALNRSLQLTRASLGEVRWRLAHCLPTEWSDCAAQMDSAVANLRHAMGLAVEPGQTPGPGTRAAFLAVKKDADAVASLLDSSAALYGGWLRRLQSMAAGYSADGTPAESWTGARISAEG